MANDILVFGEVRGGSLRKVTRELIGAARRVSQPMGGAIDAALVGALSGKAADGLAGFGLRRIIVAEDEIFARYSTEGYAKVLSDIVKSGAYSYVFLGATAMGRDLGPRVAAKVDGVMFSDCVDVRMEQDQVIARRPVYSGKVYVEIVRAGAWPNFISIRPNNIPPAEPSGGSTPIAAHASSVTQEAIRAIVTEIIPLEGGRPDLTEADIIVSGGRAMKDKANFKVLEGSAPPAPRSIRASRLPPSRSVKRARS
jgi:electron transfer flavoprotein alpha subunit